MAEKIYTDSFSGGAGVNTPGESGSRNPNLATVLRGIIDDIAGAEGAATAQAAVSAVAAADLLAIAAADIAALAAPVPVATAIPDVAETDGFVDGFIVGAPTTPSSQNADPGGETDWNVNISAGYGFCHSVGYYHAAQVDTNVSTGVRLMNIGEAMYAWIVLAEAGGVVTQEIVLGAAAALGVETIPTDGDIDTAIGHANWVKMALCHASRTADAVVATTEDPSYRVPWGGGATTLVNDIKAKYNANVTAVAELQTVGGTLRTLANELKTFAGTVRTLSNELKTRQGEVRALINDLRSITNAEGSFAPTITKG